MLHSLVDSAVGESVLALCRFFWRLFLHSFADSIIFINLAARNQ